MAYFVVSYDLHNKRDYLKIHDGIVKVSNNIWAKPLESFYIIHSNHSAEYIRDFLSNYVDKDDSIVVIITNLADWAALNIDVDALNWMYGETP